MVRIGDDFNQGGALEMAKVIISGVPPFDGEYEIPSGDTFTGDEWHLIKQVAGVRMLEFDDALTAGDWDVIVAITTIALCRDGQVPREKAREAADLIRAKPIAALDFTRDDAEADASPPAQPSTGNEPTGNDAGSSPSSSPSSSVTSDGHPAISLASIGNPGSAESAA